MHRQNIDQLHAYDCYQKVTEPQATEIISLKKYARVQHRSCESGLARACCSQADPAHTAGHVGQMKSFCHVLIVAPIAVPRRNLSLGTGTASQATKQMASTDVHE